MRLRSALSLGVTATALLAVAAHGPAVGQDGAVVRSVAATCDDGRKADFPVTSRLRGGPDTYRAGDAARAWTLELRNASGAACGAVHPVMVLVDRGRDLKPGQVRLRFQDPDGRWHPVPFERTGRAEHVGVFDDGFPGFSLAPGSSVSVPVRLAFAPGTGANEVTANVAVVQRRGDDGDWVGQSRDYAFTIEEAPSGPGEPRRPEGRLEERPEERRAEEYEEGREEHSVLAATGVGPGRDGSLLGLGAAAGALLAAGTALVAGARRLRRPADPRR